MTAPLPSDWTSRDRQARTMPAVDRAFAIGAVGRMAASSAVAAVASGPEGSNSQLMSFVDELSLALRHPFTVHQREVLAEALGTAIDARQRWRSPGQQ